MDIRYLKFKTPHEKRAFHVSGVGIREKMQSGIVDRPDGTGDRLLMFFYDPIQIEVHGKVKSFPGNTLMLWKDKNRHWYGNEKIPWSHSWIHFHGTKAQAVLAEGDLNSGEAIQFNRPEIMTNWLSIIYKELISQIKPDQIILKNQGFFRNINTFNRKRLQTPPPHISRKLHTFQHRRLFFPKIQ